MKSAFNYTYILLLFFLLAIGISCEDAELTGKDYEGDYTGLWEFHHGGGDYTYLSVDEDSVIYAYYDFSEQCTTFEKYAVDRIDEGSFYVLSNADENRDLVLGLTRSEKRLHVKRMDDESGRIIKYRMSTTNPRSLTPECGVES